jgi:hypothetical protein
MQIHILLVLSDPFEVMEQSATKSAIPNPTFVMNADD